MAECPIQLECRVSGHYPILNESTNAHAIHVEVLRAHVADAVRLPGTNYVDPQVWDPLIMKFCDFFGDGEPLIPSRLAEGWRMPGRLEAAVSCPEVFLDLLLDRRDRHVGAITTIGRLAGGLADLETSVAKPPIASATSRTARGDDRRHLADRAGGRLDGRLHGVLADLGALRARSRSSGLGHGPV